MSMALTIDLPDELASRLAALVPEEERSRFSVAAIADALMLREDEEDCVEVVERALMDMDAGRGLVSFGEVSHHWDSEKGTQETYAVR
jgi:predicted transcriptional regulator